MSLSNNLVRIATGLIGIPVVLVTAYVGGWLFLGLVGMLALLAQVEMYHLLRATGVSPHVRLGLALGVLVLLRTIYGPALGVALALLIVAFAASPLLPGTRRRGAGSDETPPPEASLSLAATLFGVVYPTMLLGFLAEIRTGPGLFDEEMHGFALTAGTLILVWTTDTMAYFIGRAVGKRPFAPGISPKKTWEGTIGGALCAVLAGILLKLSLLSFLSWTDAAVLAVLCGVLGQLGDLAESKMKRMVGVKDSGALLPGHGGMLDRFDSLILAAPAVYLYLHYAATSGV